MHRVSYLLSEGFQVMAIGTQSVFEFANFMVKAPFYQVANYSMKGGAVRSSLGMEIQTRAVTARSTADTWMVAGVIDPVANPASAEVLRFVGRVSRTARRVVGLCTGAFVLAESGALSGRRATTHWAFADAMQRRHPDIQVEADRIFIADGNIWTSAGMTAGLDLALGMVEKDLGAEVARSVAHHLVMHQQRIGGQSQHSELLKLSPKSDRIQQAIDYARQNLASSLSVEQLADVAHLSPRQFSRVFTQETGQSPSKAIEGLRLEAARLMIEKSRHPLEQIAKETGFRDRRHLREVFIRGYGTAPRMLRQARTTQTR